MLCRHWGGPGGGILQPPGAHSQEAAEREQTPVILRQEQDQQKGAAITQSPLLVTRERQRERRVQSSDCQHCSEREPAAGRFPDRGKVGGVWRNQTRTKQFLIN